MTNSRKTESRSSSSGSGVDAGAIEDRVGGEDGHADPDGQRDGVGRAGVDVDGPLAELEDEPRAEGLVREVGDDDLLDGHAELLERAGEQVVGQRPLGRDALQPPGDGVGLVTPIQMGR